MTVSKIQNWRTASCWLIS